MRFFALAHRLVNMLWILFGSAAVITVISLEENYYIFLAAVPVIVSAVDLVFGFATKVSDHKFIKSKFSDLENAIINHPGDEQYNQYCTDRLTIEQGEPPKLHALDLLCHNEVVAASYDRDEISKHIVIIPWLYRWTAQFVAWPNIGTDLR